MGVLVVRIHYGSSSGWGDRWTGVRFCLRRRVISGGSCSCRRIAR
jgi:hypothetical protein